MVLIIKYCKVWFFSMTTNNKKKRSELNLCNLNSVCLTRKIWSISRFSPWFRNLSRLSYQHPIMFVSMMAFSSLSKLNVSNDVPKKPKDFLIGLYTIFFYINQNIATCIKVFGYIVGRYLYVGIVQENDVLYCWNQLRDPHIAFYLIKYAFYNYILFRSVHDKFRSNSNSIDLWKTSLNDWNDR